MGPTPGNVTVADQESRFTALLGRTGCKDVACLIGLPAEKLLPGNVRDWGWEPTIDGVDLTGPAALLASRGKLAPVPVIVGSAMEDSAPASMTCIPSLCSEANFRRWATNAFGYNTSETDRLTSVYADETVRPGGTGHAKWYWAGAHAGADLENTCPSRRLARWVAQAGQEAYWYYWTYAPKGPNGAYPSLAHHGVEVSFVFDRFIDGSEVGLATAVVKYRASFAAGGRPDGAVTWEKYDDTKQGALVFGDNMSIAMSPGLRGDKCNFWDSHWGDSWKG